MKFALVSFLAYVLLVDDVKAAPASSTVELIKACRVVARPKSEFSWEELVDASGCIGYLYGFLGGYGISPSPDQRTICPPKGMSQGQLAAVFVKWADENPAQWHVQPWISLHAALSHGFPCK